MTPPPPRSTRPDTLFPYTTLCRSAPVQQGRGAGRGVRVQRRAAEVPRRGDVPGACAGAAARNALSGRGPSTLQSGTGCYRFRCNRRGRCMTCFVCSTCGTQFGESAGEPERCPVCEDERQYVGRGGPQWTTLEALRDTPRNRVRSAERRVGYECVSTGRSRGSP